MRRNSLPLVPAASTLLGLAAWLLAGWGDDIAFNVFPLQVAAAVAAVVLGFWVWRNAAGAGGSPTLARVLAAGGLVVGGAWLLGIGALYLIWPH